MRKIDVHHHFMPSEYLAAVGVERAAMPGSAGFVEPWTAEQSLSLMDSFEIKTALLSVSAPGVGMDTAARTAELARWCNDAQADIVAKHPQRFGMFGILPLPDLDAGLQELQYCYDVLKADGIVVMSNYLGSYIGEKQFWPIFEELNRRRGILLIHPTLPHGFRGFSGVSLSTLEFPFDTARAIASVLYSGAPRRFSEVRFIWSHAGGAMPYLAGRTATLSRRNKQFELSGDGLLSALRGFYYDLTQSANRGTVACLKEITSLDHLLFGSDCPFAREAQVQATLNEVDDLSLSDEQMEKICYSNACGLFPRFGKPL